LEGSSRGTKEAKEQWIMTELERRLQGIISRREEAQRSQNKKETTI
jgi:hypothetical protein